MRHFATLLFTFALLLSRLTSPAEAMPDIVKISPPVNSCSHLSDCEETFSEEGEHLTVVDTLAPEFFQPVFFSPLSAGDFSCPSCSNITTRRPLYCLHRVYLI